MRVTETGAGARRMLAVACTAVLAVPAAAQGQGGPMGDAPRFSPGVSALVGHQAKADRDGGGDVGVTRYFASLSGSRIAPGGTILGVSLGAGGADYSFGGAPLWDDVEERRLSVSFRTRLGERASMILVPSLRETAETGASLSDGRTWGVFGAVFWDVSDRLSIGPGIGVFSRLERDRTVFPFLAIDWDVTDRWNLSTGQGVGATQGPGLTLSYAVTDALRVGLAGRIESAEFRLDDSGAGPGGVGGHDSFPVVATVGWQPNPGTSVSAFAGMEYGGELTVRDDEGRLLSRTDYDDAPVVGGQVSLRF
ncbi:hypothetical protein ACVDG3_04255 [Meridianimarinicoccus sp. RP-17]|uniref:hypothetical protein n=1 Tax=Meridianimarinicoccus zhengii TaxID=2056810 RepID=UPI000DACD1AF|nr:hypothetical protein [Phycocomes zhengii]